MMDVGKILYVTNLETKDLSTNLIENTLAMRQVGLKEVISLQVASRDEWTKDLADNEITSKILVEEKLRLSKILTIAKDEEVSVIAVNLDRKTRKSVQGSLIQNLIRRSSVPILIINDSGHPPKSPKKELFEHVVIAMDWSSASDKALTYFFMFEKMVKALEIVNVINDKLTIKDIRELKERLTKTRKLCLNRGIDAESHIYAGKTSEEIITAAKDYKASLIVLGVNSRKNIFKKLFKRSSSYKIAERAQVPVLVVP
jgi:nucleotide-binding universal stress UspA family protein